MKDRGRFAKINMWDVLLCALFVVLMVLVLRSKVNLYVDEVCSYGLANHNAGPYMSIEDGRTYYPAGTPWTEYMAVDEEHCFDYGSVWANQTQDVHPPLYYVLLHTVCSLFPGIFTIWFAGLINIVFALGTLYFVGKLVRLQIEDVRVRRLILLGFVCSTGILSAASFLRMYIMAMFWVTAVTYLLMRQTGHRQDVRFYLPLLLCTVGGALTHYYCIVYTVFISAVYACCLLYKKRFIETLFFSLTQGGGALLSVAIFPAMIRHIFSSARGEQSVDNLIGASASDWGMRIRLFFDMSDRQLFGGIFVYILIAGLLLCAVCGLRFVREELTALRTEEKTIETMRSLCGIVPLVLYFVLISKIAVYLTDRYMYPVYAVLYAAVMCAVCRVIKAMAPGRYVCVSALVMALILVNGWRNADWSYLYRSSQTLLDAAADYADADCVFVYHKPWEPNAAYYEARQYHSVTFLTEDDLERLRDLDVSTHYELILMTTDNDEQVLEEALEMCPYLEAYEHLGEYSYTNTYYLHPAQDR